MLLEKIEHRHPAAGCILSFCGSLVRKDATRGGSPCGIRAAKRTPDYANQGSAADCPQGDLIGRAAAGAPVRRGEGLSCAGHHLLNIIPVRGGGMHNHLLRPATRCERWSCRSAAIAMHMRSNSCGGGPGQGLGLFGITGNTL